MNRKHGKHFREGDTIVKDIYCLLRQFEAGESSCEELSGENQLHGVHAVCQSAYRLLEAVEDWLGQAKATALDTNDVFELLLIVHSDIKRFTSEVATPEIAHTPARSSCVESEASIDDPWEDCEDIFIEDLLEWFTHSLTQHRNRGGGPIACLDRINTMDTLQSITAAKGSHSQSYINEKFGTPEHMSTTSTEVGGEISRTISSSEMSVSSFGRSFGKEAWRKSWQAELRRSTTRSLDSADSLILEDAASHEDVRTVELLPARPKASIDQFGLACHLLVKNSEELDCFDDSDDWEDQFLRSSKDDLKTHSHASQAWNDLEAGVSSYGAAAVGYFSHESEATKTSSSDSSDWEEEFLRRSSLP
mmetsp:Transcript_35362/g.56360  ORF Transcript_35362/g.56360 Transcript_35362/m.56360 type:complete len:362 (+) Transcript_35362:99-1184(+)